MSQEQVYNLLKKSKKPMAQYEIYKKLGLAQSVCSKNLKDLLKWKDITYKIVRIKLNKNRVKDIRVYSINKNNDENIKVFTINKIK